MADASESMALGKAGVGLLPASSGAAAAPVAAAAAAAALMEPRD